MHYDANKLLFKIGNFIKMKSVSSLHWKTSLDIEETVSFYRPQTNKEVSEMPGCLAVSLSSGLSGLNFVALC